MIAEAFRRVYLGFYYMGALFLADLPLLFQTCAVFMIIYLIYKWEKPRK